MRLKTPERGKEKGNVPDGPGHLGKRYRVLPGVSLPVDECRAEEEVEVAGETGGLFAVSWGRVRGLCQ